MANAVTTWYLLLARDGAAGNWQPSALKRFRTRRGWGAILSNVVAVSMSRRPKGKHRKVDHRIQPYTWLGAGAITLGVGAAMVSGAGVASAEEGSGGGSSTSSNSGSTNGPASGAEGAVGGQSDQGGTQQPGDNLPPSNPVNEPEPQQDNTASASGSTGSTLRISQPGSPVSTVSASSVVVKSKDEDAPVIPRDPPPAVSPVSTIFSVRESQPTVPTKSDPVKNVDLELEISSPATSFVSASSAVPSSLRSAGIDDEAPSAGIQTLALMATAAAVDPAREAYIQQFRNADPNGIYSTPASPGYAFTPVTLTEAEYRTFIADYVGRVGTSGFSQTSTGALQYINTYDQNVAVIYGPKAGGVAEPTGIRIVRPGQTVILPTGAEGAVASAQLPRSGTQIREVSVAAVGYPPFTRVPTGPNPPRTNPVATVAASITTVFNALNRAFSSSVGSFVVNGIDFVANYAVPAFRQATQTAVKATFDGLTSIQKSLLLGRLAEAGSNARTTLSVVTDTFRTAFTRVAAAFIPLNIYNAYQASANARTELDQVHAGLDTFAANAPLAGAVIGLSVGGPPGAALGFAIGSAAGLGVAIGNNISRLFSF